MRYTRTPLKSDKKKLKANIIRHTLYAVLVLVFYTFSVCGAIRDFQPALVVPLAAAVSMREKEIISSVYGAVCGLALDAATNTLFGFGGVLVMVGCCFISFLITNLIKVNAFNHFLMSLFLCLFTGFMTYFFKYAVWNGDPGSVILNNALFPSYFSAVILAPAVYFIVKKIADRFTPSEDL
jgi:rod shape-determining protein MreD